MDDPSFAPSGPHEHAMPPGEHGTATEGDRRARRAALPGAKGRFGRDICTEEYEPLNDAPGGAGQRDP
jgi:hypothetical protein